MSSDQKGNNQPAAEIFYQLLGHQVRHSIHRVRKTSYVYSICSPL